MTSGRRDRPRVRPRPAIEFRRVTRVFGRDGTPGLRGLSFSVDRGLVAALTGPNGVGKTTALRLAATLVMPSEGSVLVSGYDVVRRARRVRQLVGLSLGGARSFYWRITAAHNLSFFAALRGVAPDRAGAHVRGLAEEMGFAGALDAPARGLSRGNLGRMAVARALVGDPQIVLLDEPFTAIDREGRKLLWNALARRVRSGSTVLLTTHDPGVASRCDVVRRIER